MHKVSKKVKVDFNKTFTGTRMKVFQACVSFLSFCFIKDVANISSLFCIFSHNYIMFKIVFAVLLIWNWYGDIWVNWLISVLIMKPFYAFSWVKGFVTKRSQSLACTVRLWGVFGSDILQCVVSFTITCLQCFVLANTKLNYLI